MIRPLRDRHRWLVPLIALVTALVFGWALSGRHRAEPPTIPVIESPR
jgi:hypothetical protein